MFPAYIQGEFNMKIICSYASQIDLRHGYLEKKLALFCDLLKNVAFPSNWISMECYPFTHTFIVKITL